MLIVSDRVTHHSCDDALILTYSLATTLMFLFRFIIDDIYPLASLGDGDWFCPECVHTKSQGSTLKKSAGASKDWTAPPSSAAFVSLWERRRGFNLKT
jgi:hypothetical protein